MYDTLPIELRMYALCLPTPQGHLPEAQAPEAGAEDEEDEYVLEARRRCHCTAEQLADVARVPVKRREGFIAETAARLDWEVLRPWPEGDLTAYSAVATKVRAARDAVYKLSKGEQQFLSFAFIFGAPEHYERLRKHDFDIDPTWWLGMFDAAVASFALMMRDDPSPGVVARRGRRSGSVKDYVFQTLVRDLWVIADDHGGRLTFDRKSKSGAMIKALNLLKSESWQLRDRVIPNCLPFSTIGRIIGRLRQERYPLNKS
jgi:hypothetical protein